MNSGTEHVLYNTWKCKYLFPFTVSYQTSLDYFFCTDWNWRRALTGLFWIHQLTWLADLALIKRRKKSLTFSEQVKPGLLESVGCKPFSCNPMQFLFYLIIKAFGVLLHYIIFIVCHCHFLYFVSTWNLSLSFFCCLSISILFALACFYISSSQR